MAIQDPPIQFDGQLAVFSFDAKQSPRRVTLFDGTQATVGDSVWNNEQSWSGRLVGFPSGLCTNVFEERNAAVEVDCQIPSSAVGRHLFLEQANGLRTIWTITAVQPVGTHTLLTLDRSAREFIYSLVDVDASGRVLTPASLPYIEPKSHCLIDGQWYTVEPAENAGEK
jgi:hypothetical protein